jgi:hypothetical protein
LLANLLEGGEVEGGDLVPIHQPGVGFAQLRIGGLECGVLMLQGGDRVFIGGVYLRLDGVELRSISALGGGEPARPGAVAIAVDIALDDARNLARMQGLERVQLGRAFAVAEFKAGLTSLAFLQRRARQPIV